MKKKIIITLCIVIILLNMLIPQNVHAAKNEEEFFDEDITWEWEYQEEGALMAYGLLTPSNADKLESLPLIVYLHGSGNTAVSESALRETGLPGALQSWDLENFSAYVLCPQLLDWNGYWENESELSALIDEIIDQYSIDTDNIVICGESRGGTGALYMAYHLPEYFSKCVAFSSFYGGPYNTSMDTLCFYASASPAMYELEVAEILKRTYGDERVFATRAGHGSVGRAFMQNDSDDLAQYGIGVAR